MTRIPNSERLRRIGLAGILLTAFVLRLGIVLAQNPSDLTSYSENGTIAKSIVEGRGYTFSFYGLRREAPLESFMPPLYTGVIWLCLTQFENPARALGVIHALLSTLTVGLVFVFALKLTSNRTVAWLSTIGAAFYPPLILSTTRAQTLTLNVFLISLVLAMSAMLRDKRSCAWASAVGIALGIGVHSRPMLIGFLPILAIWLWLNPPSHKARTLRLCGIASVWVILTLVPWSVRNFNVHRQFVFMSTNGGFNFWTGNNPFTTGSGHEVYTDQAYAFMGLDKPASEPPIQEMHRYPLPSHIQTQIETIDELDLDRELYQAGWEFIQAKPEKWLKLAVTKLESFVWFRANIGARYDEAWTRYYKYLYAALLVPSLIGVALSLSKWKNYLLLYSIYCLSTMRFFTQSSTSKHDTGGRLKHSF